MAALLRKLAASRQRGRISSVSETLMDYIGRLLGAFEPAGAGRASRMARSLQAGLAEPLTDRELEVLRLLAAGRRNRQIADQLVAELDTVKKHVSHIFRKLSASNRAQAVAHARELGLLP
jgi:LuxR family maltose regulon positive regulatory protein